MKIAAQITSTDKTKGSTEDKRDKESREQKKEKKSKTSESEGSSNTAKEEKLRKLREERLKREAEAKSKVLKSLQTRQSCSRRDSNPILTTSLSFLSDTSADVWHTSIVTRSRALQFPVRTTYWWYPAR